MKTALLTAVLLIAILAGTGCVSQKKTTTLPTQATATSTSDTETMKKKAADAEEAARGVTFKPTK